MRPLKFTKTWVVWLFLLGAAWAQDWGPMQFIWWQYWPQVDIGVFNPSYCSEDSLLYFDGYYRREIPFYSIFVSKYNGNYSWGDPVELPAPISNPPDDDIINAMPDITASGDTLFFCSNREGTYGGLDIWMSVKTDSLWSEPVNLGDSVNSETDELSPHYAAGINTLFFDRLEESIGNYCAIYTSVYLGDNIWQTPQRLPETINYPDSSTYDPTYDENTCTLYFNFGLSYGININIFSSTYTGGNWSEPRILSDNVNGLYTPNVNNWVQTFGASISSDGQLLFYSKKVWEYNCIDFTSFLFFSEKVVDIAESFEKPENTELAVKIYPNPSNSSFSFNVSSTIESYDLSIYNMLGQLTKEFNNYTVPTIIWDGTDNEGEKVSSGIYFARARSKEINITKRLVYLK